MSLLFQKRTTTLADAGAPGRASAGGAVRVTPDSALASSAVWACLRLRADLVSTMPIDTYRKVNFDGETVQVEVPKPPVLIDTGGASVGVMEFLYSTEFDLDRSGNTVGIITARDGAGRPARIDLVPLADAYGRGVGSEIVEWRIGRRLYDPVDIWHEKQFTVSGFPFGLSPIMHAAKSLGSYLSAQEFALAWFANDVAPSGTLKHSSEENISTKVADTMKERFKVAVSQRDIFVTGSEWEYTPASLDAAQAAFIEERKFGLADVARYLGVPADLIDVEGSSASITYANITQRNLQFLVMNLGPAIARREAALSKLLAAPRFVKFNTDALLRMDPAAVVASMKVEIDSRTLTVSEARALRNRAPLTDAQIAEFDRLFPQKAAAPVTPTIGAPA